MTRRVRIIGMLAFLGVVLAAKVGQGVYRWYAYAEERTELQQLNAGLRAAGLEVVHTQLDADRLRARVEQADARLEAARGAVGAFERRAHRGTLPAHLYPAYKSEVDAYNRSVGERNAQFEEWKQVVRRNHLAVRRYNALADSIRALAGRIGEPYYAVPSPVEVAVKHGLLPSPPQ